VDGCNRVVPSCVCAADVLPALVVIRFLVHARLERISYAHVFCTNSARTVTTGLAFHVARRVLLGAADGATIMSALPPCCCFSLQRWVVKGLTLGGVKG
jgi:ABC-type maltose transport system permease subunit